MLMHPNIDPVLFTLAGPLKIRWYGVMYLLAFASAYFLGQWRAASSRIWTKPMVSDLVFYCVVGVVLGGRLGYMIFYSLPAFASDPVNALKVWEGGMSFHGGLLGVLVSMWVFARRYHLTFFQVSDFTAPLVPLGIAAGRLGNFINSELWGKVTTAPWGMVFPSVDRFPRHPTQLYEFFLEGLVLFFIVWFFSAKERPKMAISGLFSLGYGVFRFILEFYRVPDPQYGYLAWDWLTMGQVLSLPLIIMGVIMMYSAYNQKKETKYV